MADLCLAHGMICPYLAEIAEQHVEIERLRNRLLEHACSCIGTEATESGFGLDPERHEELCCYRVDMRPTPEPPDA